jgi:hypothetical protein
MDPDGPTLSPDEAFWLLGEETRMAILRAVWESPDERVPFSAIREGVGNPDSGSFNYHLNRLRGHFLSAGEDGYRLTQAGREVVRAVLAGTMTRRPETDPVPIDAECVECGGSLVGRYDENYILECGDCGASVMWNEFPPAGLDGRTPAEAATAFERWTRTRFGLATDGICPNCAAGMSTQLIADGVGAEDVGSAGTDGVGTDDAEADATDGIATDHRCENCGYEARVPLAGHVLSHPAVVSFYYERGIDVTAMPYWRMQALAREFSTAVVSMDPWRATITVESDRGALVLTLDDRLDVVDVDRPDRPEANCPDRT